MERGCAVESCLDGHYARGWCPRHYQRWRRHGNPRGSPAQVLAAAGLRRCAHCSRVLPRDRFSPKNTHEQSWCKDCCNLRSRENYSTTVAAQRVRWRRRHQEHRERELERMRRWRRENREKAARLERLRTAREVGAAGSQSMRSIEARTVAARKPLAASPGSGATRSPTAIAGPACAPGGIRTPGPYVRSVVLYPLSYRRARRSYRATGTA